MSDRPTLNELEAAASYDSGQFVAVSRFREMCAEHGYAIVHPDDVIVDSGYTEPESHAFAQGWNACRRTIFGPDE